MENRRLVEFDDAGIVKRSEPFDDRKAIRMLIAVAENAPLQLDPPLVLQVQYLKNAAAVPAKIVLSTGSFDLEELSGQKKLDTFSVPANEVVSDDMPYATGNDPSYLAPRIRFARDLRKLGGPRGKNIGLEVTMPQLVTLMSYASHANRPTPGETNEAEQK